MPSLQDIEAQLGKPEDIPVAPVYQKFAFPLGTVAPFMAHYYRRVKTAGAYHAVTAAGIKPDAYRLGGTKDDGTPRQDFLYFFDTPDDPKTKVPGGRTIAERAAKAAGTRFAELVFQVSGKVANIVGITEENIAKFRNPELVYDVQRGSFWPGDARDLWHAVWLPSAVFAAAKYFEFALPAELVESFGFHDCADRNVLQDGEQYTALFGGSDLFDSVYGKQRAALWAALGEQNPAASSLKNATISVKEHGQIVQQVAPDATVSDQLHACLRLATSPWVNVYASIANLRSPNPNYQTYLPVCIAILHTKERAEAYVAELKARGNDDHESEADPNVLPVPPNWAGVSVWPQTFATEWAVVKQADSAPKRAAAIAKAIKALEISVEWWDKCAAYTEAHSL